MAVGLGAVGLGLSASVVAWPRSRRPVAVAAAAVLAFDVMFLAFLLLQFYSVPTRLPNEAW